MVLAGSVVGHGTRLRSCFVACLPQVNLEQGAVGPHRKVRETSNEAGRWDHLVPLAVEHDHWAVRTARESHDLLREIEGGSGQDPLRQVEDHEGQGREGVHVDGASQDGRRDMFEGRHLVENDQDECTEPRLEC